MPNRVIREGFLDDEKINALTDEEQLLFIRLTLVVDDFGCWNARPEMVRSRCYPVTDKCLSFVSQSLDNLHAAGLIVIYEVAGKRYLHIPNFRQRLRKMIPKFPKPPEISDYSPPCQTAVSQSLDSRQQSAALNPESESGIRIRKDSLPPASPSVEAEHIHSKNKKPKKERPRNELFDFVAIEFQIDPEVQGSRIGKLSSQFKKLLSKTGAGTDEIKRRRENYRAKWPQAADTPEALVKHWGAMDVKQEDTHERYERMHRENQAIIAAARNARGGAGRDNQILVGCGPELAGAPDRQESDFECPGME